MVKPSSQLPPSKKETGASAKEDRPRARRFYKHARVVSTDRGYSLQLDTRALRTPLGSEFCVPTKALADAVCAEWDAQTDVLHPVSMPLTRLCNSTLEGVIPHRQTVIEDIVKFSGNDALCYRAEEPAGLVDRQSKIWDPVIDWAEQQFGVRWLCAGGVMPVEQPSEAGDAVRQRLAGISPFQLAALHELTTLTGSALLALAYQDGARTFDEIWLAAHLDEDWQIERWGVDGEAQAHRTRRREDGQAADRLFVLSSPE